MRRVVVCVALVSLASAAASAQDMAKGAAVYAGQKCSLCHSIAGKGNAKGSLDGVGSTFTAEELRQWITDPVAMSAKHKATRKPAMPTKFASLPKEDVDALVSYLASLKK